MSTLQQNQTPSVIKSKFDLALTQHKFQTLQTKADTLVFNEDNLQEIADFLKSLKPIEKAINEVHKIGKEDALRIGREWDAAKRDFLAMLTAIEEKPQAEYSRICREIEQKRADAAREKARIEAIKNGIETNALNFASRIANCKTSEELTNLERQINLEKGRKEKYQEFIDNAVERFNELNAKLAEQKIEVRKLEKLEQERLEAEKQKDDEKLLQIAEQKEVLETKIEEQKIVVQETAINQSLQDQFELAEILLPNVKAKRTTIEWEVGNIQETLKKNPDWVVLTPNKDALNEYTKQLKENATGDVDVVVNGIRFFTKKTY
jgi:chromosome segregation ATPase